MELPNTIALFDFDGTITKKDTYIAFIKHCFGATTTYLGFLLLSPVLILYKLKLIRNDLAKQITFSYFFKNMSKDDYLYKCNSFKEVINKILRLEAMHKIAYHKSKGHYLIIVSASIEDWILPWANENHFNAILSTKIEVKDGRLTGKFASENCYGEQKVVRVKQHISDGSKKYIYAYGDSNGDKQLLEFADEAFYRVF
ncbi:HAD family hydrolase [Winogradskyella sp.]|uniref:HAD family hydrolase n=1 Tax=Winogradskyella sp. TaxID=1883156 RepID=UPI003BA841B5